MVARVLVWVAAFSSSTRESSPLSVFAPRIRHQVSHPAVQRGGELLDRGQSNVSLSPFDHANERAVQASQVGQLLLPHLEEEWKFALALARERFIRACYWRHPAPGLPAALDEVETELRYLVLTLE